MNIIIQRNLVLKTKTNRLTIAFVFLVLFLLFLFLLFSCTSARHLYSGEFKHLYIGEWKQQPNTNGWANLRHKIYIDFPDYEWKVFTCPESFIKNMNTEWPLPDYTHNSYTILISAEVCILPKKLEFKLDTSKTKTVILNNCWMKNELPFRGPTVAKTVFHLNMFEISEQIGLEEFTAYIWDTFNKCMKSDIWLQEHNLKNHITEIENRSITLNNRNCIQIRYRIESSNDDNEHIMNLLVIAFKINSKIVFAQFFLEEEEYNFRIEKCYQIVNTMRQVTSEQEFYKLTEIKCSENELLLRAFSTHNYNEATEIRNKLINCNENLHATDIDCKNFNGEMICIRIDDLMPEIRNAIQQLEVKQISDIINVQSMHYIIQRMK